MTLLQAPRQKPRLTQVEGQRHHALLLLLMLLTGAAVAALLLTVETHLPKCCCADGAFRLPTCAACLTATEATVKHRVIEPDGTDRTPASLLTTQAAPRVGQSYAGSLGAQTSSSRALGASGRFSSQGTGGQNAMCILTFILPFRAGLTAFASLLSACMQHVALPWCISASSAWSS